MRVSNFSKMGDIMYSLPVLRALYRLHGEKIHLLASGSCWQLAPLLWEQPYIGEVELDESQAHATVEMERGVIFPAWEYYKHNEGYNLSLRPSYFEDTAPISWTRCAMQAAGIDELTPEDCVALPSLVNHRRWLYGIDVLLNGKKIEPPKTIIVAPETDTLDELLPTQWRKILERIIEYGHEPVIVGTRNLGSFYGCPVTDLRGLTSVPVLARLIAESRGFIGAHSFPWHLARHSETPAVCLQMWREGLRRCLPIDTNYTWMEPPEWERAVDRLLQAHSEKVSA